MTKYILSFGESVEHVPEYPERTAKKSFGAWDMIYQVWPSRKAMAKTIRLQQRGPYWTKCWNAVIALSDSEGY